jgi:Nif-specific regulatory protein
MYVGSTRQTPEPHEQTRCERDLYKRLLELGHHRHIRPFLEESLELLIQLVGAARGSLELRDRSGDPSLLISRGFDAGDRIRGFSRSVVAEAFATGQTIVTASAQIDPRFSTSCSVRSHALEAVLCVPFGDPPLGIVYLQDRRQPGPFTQDDRARVETFARQIAVFADRLRRLGQDSKGDDDGGDPTQLHRRSLRGDSLVGASPAMAELLKQVAMVAPLQISVLITGPSGSGKTQLAKLIHDNSRRASGPFVELNCGALPGELIENELYGAAPGAHSTAAKRSEGKVAAAEGGTLFLDEVGELPVRAQASLLQLLQARSYFPLGSATPRAADVRILAATNRNLGAAVTERRFREDLYYRLNVFPLRVPSLVERPADIPLLAEHFCRLASHNNGLPELPLDAGALTALEDAEWPGEIRELAHAVEVGVVRAHGDGAGRVERQHLFPQLIRDADRRVVNDTFEDDETGQDQGVDPLTLLGGTRRFQRQLVRQTLLRAGGNVTAAARQLQVTRTHMYNLMSSLGIRPRRPQRQGG